MKVIMDTLIIVGGLYHCKDSGRHLFLCNHIFPQRSIQIPSHHVLLDTFHSFELRLDTLGFDVVGMNICYWVHKIDGEVDFSMPTDIREWDYPVVCSPLISLVPGAMCELMIGRRVAPSLLGTISMLVQGLT